MTSPDTAIMKTEVFDVDALSQLLNCDGISTIDKNRLRSMKRASQQGNQLRVAYLRGKNLKSEDFGRVTPEKGIGLAMVPRDQRNFLARPYYFDLDMVNSQPTILEQMCKTNGWACEYLTQFLAERDARMKELHADRSQAKQMVMRMMFGKLDVSDKLDFFFNLERQLDTITNNLYASAPEEIKKIAKKHKTYNHKGSVCASVLQQEEFKCLMALDKILCREGRELAVLMHDGGYVRKLDSEFELPATLIKTCEEFIKEQTGYNVVLKQKEMETTFILDTADHYKDTKIEFEKNNFKVLCPIEYVRITPYGTVQRITFSELNEIYAPMGSFIEKWKVDPFSRTYEKLGFFPRPSSCPNDQFNLFEGFAVQKIEPDTPQSIDRIFNQMRSLVSNNDEYFQYFLRYVAHMFQYPEIKSKIALIFNGGQGTGKDTFWDFIGSLLGSDLFFSTGRAEDDVFGRFNDNAAQRILIKLEETNHAVLKNNKERLKTLITQPVGIYESKGKKPLTLNSYERYVLTTNEENPTYIEDGERRMCIFTPSSQHCGDTKYFDELCADYRNPDIKRTFYDYLMAVDLTGFDILKRPITETYKETKLSSAPIIARFFGDCVYDNMHISWTPTELVQALNERSRYETNTIALGRQLKQFVESRGLVQSRQNERRYKLHCENMKAYLKSKGWWNEMPQAHFEEDTTDATDA